MLNVDFSINPLTNRRQIAVNGAEERLSECCGSRDIPLEEWKGNCFEVLAKKYNDDVLSVSFTGMAKDFRFLSYLKNGAETEKKLQITLTEKTVYEPERLYRELGEAIREYNASEYDFLHEEYRKITGGMTEIVFLTPEAGWTSDRLKPLLYDSDKNEYYAERKVTVVDAATADSLPEPEHALYYIHLCDLDRTAFKKSKQYLEKIRSLLNFRSRRTLPDTFFLCEYDFESEEYEDLCDRIDSVLKENTIPLLAFNRKSVSEEVKKTTETFFGDYVFGGCLHTASYQSLIKMIQTNKEQSDIQELQNLILEKKEMLTHVLHEKDLLLTNNLTTKLSFDKLNLDLVQKKLIEYFNQNPVGSSTGYCIRYQAFPPDWTPSSLIAIIESETDDCVRNSLFLDNLKMFFLQCNYPEIYSVSECKEKNYSVVSEKLILEVFNVWMTQENINTFLNHEKFFSQNTVIRKIKSLLESGVQMWSHDIEWEVIRKLLQSRFSILFSDILAFFRELQLYVSRDHRFFDAFIEEQKKEIFKKELLLQSEIDKLITDSYLISSKKPNCLYLIDYINFLEK